MRDDEPEIRSGALVAAQQPRLPVPVRLDVQLRAPALDTARKLAGALIYVASQSGGVGRDTLSAMLLTAAQMRGLPTTLIEMANRPGFARRSQRSEMNRREHLPLDTVPEEAAEWLGRIIYERQQDTIVVNAAPDANPVLWDAEEENRGTIEQLGTRVRLFWMGSADGLALRAVKTYRASGGVGVPIIARRRKRSSLFDDDPGRGEEQHGWAELEVPELPRSIVRMIAEDGSKLSLADALGQASLPTLAIFERAWNRFLLQLNEVL